MTLPLVKLATILIKQLSKPVANAIKKTVKTDEKLSQVISVPAQAYHRLEQTVRMRWMGWTKKVDVKPLSNEAAVDLGAELLGEFVVFSVAVGTLYAESKRQKGKDRRKEEEQNSKLFELQNQINELNIELSSQHEDTLRLTEHIDELNEKIKSLTDKQK